MTNPSEEQENQAPAQESARQQENSLAPAPPEILESKEDFLAFAESEGVLFNTESDKELAAVIASHGLDDTTIEKIKNEDGIMPDLEALKGEAKSAVATAVAEAESKESEAVGKLEQSKTIINEFIAFLDDPAFAGLTYDEISTKVAAAEKENPELYAHAERVSKLMDIELDQTDKETVEYALEKIGIDVVRNDIFKHYVYRGKNSFNPYAQREELLAGIAKYDLFKNPEEREAVIREFNNRITDKGTSSENQVYDSESAGYHAKKTPVPLVHLNNPQPNSALSFKDLNQTGNKVTEDGTEKIVRGSTYPIANTLKLNITGNSIKYSNPTDPVSSIAAVYDPDLNEVTKMNFSSENPLFAGKAMLDMAERIPVGATIFKGEDSMSSDSFPIFMKSLSQFEKKSPGRFTVEQIGEFDMNNQGKFSKVSKAGSLEEQLALINQNIDEYTSLGAASVPHARIIELPEGKHKIVLPKLKVTKNF